MRRTIFILIIILGFILRFWNLGNNPPALDWDEASLGYNAYSILKTGRDEYGDFLPKTIRSFSDYKPPGYTYLTILPILFFGLNEFATRFISAIAGTISIVIVYFLLKEMLSQQSNKLKLLALFLLTISPWHLQFSRVAFEANLALFFFLAGLLFYLKGLKTGTWLFISFISFAASMYSYHSPRLVIPILIIGLFFIYFKSIMKHINVYIPAVVLFLILIVPIANQIRSATGARFSSVTVLKPTERLKESIETMNYDKERGNFFGKLIHNRRIVFGREIIAGYLDHFNIDFLFLNGDAAGRHHAVGMGMLYKWEFPFILLGIFYLVKNRSRGVILLFSWFLIAPVASSLTEATPHAVRSLLFLPTFQIFSASGLFYLLHIIHSKILKQGVIYIILIIGSIGFYYYLHMYWVHTPIEYAQWWQYGYKEVVEEVSRIKNRFDKIIVTYQYDQPYIYFLYYNQYDPRNYQKQWSGSEILRAQRAFDKYEFRNIEWEKDSRLENVLLIGTPKEIPEGASGLFKEIHFPDGSVAFRLVAR